MDGYADFTFYSGVYGGTDLDQETFERLVPRASCYLDNITLGRVREPCEEIRRAACAVAEAMRREELGGAVAAETVGRHSVQYAGGQPSPAARVYAAAALYLFGTGLLYHGI